MSLHALAYCERLFYLEEVEGIRVADAALLDGCRVHEELDGGELASYTLEAPLLGLRGRVDAVRCRDGQLMPVEVKKGRAAPAQPGGDPDGGGDGKTAWSPDRIQLGAYALLLEEALGVRIDEGRVRYLADQVTVRVPIDDALRQQVHAHIARARALRLQVVRPPVTDNERLCVRCSLAPVCLPEEERLARDPEHQPVRLFPPHPDRLVLHVLESGTHVGRKGDQLAVRPREGGETLYPIRRVGAVVIHGYAQISTQALRLCCDHDVMVQWMTPTGQVMGSLVAGGDSPQRHLRQFRALEDGQVRLHLARLLVASKIDAQLHFLLRGSRGASRSEEMKRAVEGVRQAARQVPEAADVEQLLGLEGSAAAAYFEGLALLLRPDLDERLRFARRSRRPAADRVNTLLNYGYGMLYRECLAAIQAVGLHPGVGFYHRPRSSALPLALDLMELFRVPLVDMAVVAALNRDTFDADADFEERGGQVWLTDDGRQKAIEVFERRKRDEWKHSVVGYSLCYARMIELEVRLLEKEWSGEGKLFARFRLR
ncbi:MAG: type I-MYXAN CRISPR-associated endonuclease Cas1 [Myxococcales bacterium]|nr:type I-MYXAN CRISPR-associated endonuclease Cas1 [Myxococcota bacterium]MDW8284328.1 type I-MYXAN CRISPR-associated endonuclease Cas1 [Myxococcales bacterium]